MRLFEITGNTEEFVYVNMLRVMIMLTGCSKALPSRQRDEYIAKYTSLLHADKENLLSWVTRSKRIADVYYSIPTQYRKI